MEEETEDQRGEVTCLRQHSWQAAEQDWNPGRLTPEPPLNVITKLFCLYVLNMADLSLVFLVSPFPPPL